MKITIHVQIDDPEGTNDNSYHVVSVPPAQAPIMRAVFAAWRASGHGLAAMVYAGLCRQVLHVWEGAQHVANHGSLPSQNLRKR